MSNPPVLAASCRLLAAALSARRARATRARAPGVIAVALPVVAALMTYAPLDANAAAELQLRLRAFRFDPLAAAPALPAGLTAPVPAGGEPVVAIVQFEGPPGAADRERLRAAGIEVLDYVPDFAYLVAMRAPLGAARAATGGVRWVGLLQPAYRLSPDIGRLQHLDRARAAAPDYTLRVDIVRAFGGATGAGTANGAALPAVTATIETLGGRVLAVAPGTDALRLRLRVALPRGRQAELARQPAVLWIEEEPDYRVWNDTTRWVVQSNQSGVTPLWDHGLHGQGQLAVVMDSGLDYASCWFRDSGNPPPGPTHRKVIDYKEWGGNAYDGCDIGHGTHVCGTLAGDQSFINPGNQHANGIADAAQLALQDVGDDGWLSCLLGLLSLPASLAAPLQDAYDLGARVHSNSWGSISNTYDSMARDIDAFMWDHPDFLVLFAAGNWGPGSGTVGAPGTAKNCVTVGATRQAPEQNTIAGYSSRGPASDGRLKPTLAAPGGENPVFITSADNDPDSNPTCQTVSSPFQGTSMATPAVAGMALLVRQYFADGWYPQGEAGSGPALAPSAALVKAVLVNAGTDMAALDIPNQNEGWGRLLAGDALYFTGDARELRVEQHAGVATGETASFTWDVEAGEPLEVVLVWTDYPAATGSGTALVNDLDLTVSGPGGTYLGNVFSGGQSVTGGSHDRLNVEEVVRLASPPGGFYTIEVRGFNVPQGAPGSGQPFALAATGAFAGWPPAGTGIAEPGEAGGGAGGAAADGGAEADGAGDAPGVVRRERLALHAARPNPFNPATDIRYELAGGERAYVRVVLYDAAGRRVRALVDRVIDPGLHTAAWDGRDAAGRELPSGVYYVQLLSGGVRISQKLALVR